MNIAWDLSETEHAAACDRHAGFWYQMIQKPLISEAATEQDRILVLTPSCAVISALGEKDAGDALLRFHNLGSARRKR